MTSGNANILIGAFPRANQDIGVPEFARLLFAHRSGALRFLG
jgi:hypothetical protein